MQVFIVASICLAGACAMMSWEIPDDVMSHVTDEMDLDWIEYKKAHNKTYESAKEEVVRRLYWKDTLRFIRDHNLRYDRGEVTYTVVENQFADMAEDEFEKTMLRGLIVPEEGAEVYPEALTEPDPNASPIDWRQRRVVTPVKDQDGRCRYRRRIGSSIRGYRNVGKSEHSLASALSRVGPIAVAADCSDRGFSLFKCGIYYNPNCQANRLNHAMVLVGYVNSTAGNYWIIKNSWGTKWGDKGYVYMAKDKGDTCGLRNLASYPTL